MKNTSKKLVSIKYRTFIRSLRLLQLKGEQSENELSLLQKINSSRLSK